MRRDDAMSEAATVLTRLTRPLARMISGGADDNVATFFRGASGVFVVQIASAGLLLVSHAVFARMMGVESFGIYVLAYAWLNVLLLAGRHGFDVATVRYVASYQGQSEWGLFRGYLRFSRIVVLASSVAVSGAVALAVWHFRSRLGDEAAWAYWLAAATLPVFALVQIHESAIRGLGFVVRPLIYMRIFHPAALIVVLPLAVVGFGVPVGADVGMAIFLGATAVSLFGLWAMWRRKCPGEGRVAERRMQPREWMKASMAMMFLMSFGPILNQISVIALGMLDDTAAAGLYGAAARISYVLAPLIASLNAAIAPLVADLHARGEHDELQRIARLGVRTVFAFAFAVAVVVIAMGPWILGFLGEEYAAAYPMMVVLLCGQLVFAAAGPAGILLNMTGFHVDSAKVLAFGAIVNLVLCVILIPMFGALGAAVATATTVAVWSGAMAYVTSRRLGIVSFFTVPLSRPILVLRSALTNS